MAGAREEYHNKGIFPKITYFILRGLFCVLFIMCVCVRVCVCVCACVHAYIYIYMDVRMYLCMRFTCMCVCMYVSCGIRYVAKRWSWQRADK
jgi:hypothetical protein